MNDIINSNRHFNDDNMIFCNSFMDHETQVCSSAIYKQNSVSILSCSIVSMYVGIGKFSILKHQRYISALGRVRMLVLSSNVLLAYKHNYKCCHTWVI